MKVNSPKKSCATLLTVLVAALTGCSSMQVYIDYDRSADFQAYETFMFVDHPEDSMSTVAPLIHDRLVDSISAAFEDAGYQRVEQDGDLMVTYYTSTEQEFRADTTHWGYGYPSPWYRYGYGYGGWGWGGSVGTTQVTSYDVGTLVVDAVDAAEKTLIWRGVASDVVPDSPDKLSKKLDSAIDRMVTESQKKM